MTTMRDTSNDEEGLALVKAIDATLVFCAAWTLWKSKHDVDSLELNCCEASRTLHSSANMLERSVRHLLLNKNFIRHIFGAEVGAIVERETKRILEQQELELSKKSSKH